MEVDGANGCIRAFTQLKQQYKELRVILSIGGGGAGSQPFPAIAADPVAAEIFASSARKLVDEYGIDGIDSTPPPNPRLQLCSAIFLPELENGLWQESHASYSRTFGIVKVANMRVVDWEHPSDSQQGINYVYLLSRLRDRLPSPRFTLTSALPAGEWALRHINLAAAQNYLDFINLMAYDFSGPWVEECGHHAQLFSPSNPHNEASKMSGHAAVTYAISQGVPSKKILLGIPVYGRSFIGAKYVGDKYTGSSGDDGTYDYRDLVNCGVPHHTDDEVGAAFCHHEQGGFVSFDNVQTVKMKATYAVQNKLGGLFYWHITSDARGSSSLIKTGYNTLHDF
jgi:chitinase